VRLILQRCAAEGDAGHLEERPGAALAGWDAIVRLAAATGQKLAWSHARDVFKDMTQTVAAWKDLTWQRDVRPLALRFAGSRG